MILQRQVSTRWEKIGAFFDDLAQRAEAEGGFMAIVEVCGMNPWLIEMLQEYGCREIVITQPDHRSKNKTDRPALIHLRALMRRSGRFQPLPCPPPRLPKFSTKRNQYTGENTQTM